MDNSPHHKDIETYPHHKHQEEKILPSYEITIQDILQFIAKTLEKN